MNRNTVSRFSLAPQVGIERSTFDRSCTVKTSFNCGDVIPFYCEPIVPGDSYKVSTTKVARMQTLKTPMMDDVFLDTYYFFVPNRLVWTHWEEFCGANKQSAWIPQSEYILPQITAPAGGWAVGSLADYLGVPPLVDNLTIKNALRFRCYAKIIDDWFRSDSIQDPLVIETGDSTVAGSNGTDYVTDVAKGGMPFTACRTFDYFSSCLLSPQRGPDVSINAFADNQLLPVYASTHINQHFLDPNISDVDDRLAEYVRKVNSSGPVQYESYNGHIPEGAEVPWPLFQQVTKDKADTNEYNHYSLWGKESANYNTFMQTGAYKVDGTVYPIDGVTVSDYASKHGSLSLFTPVNLVAESSGKYLWTSINDLRQAFQIQRFYEKAARSGSGRYVEIIKAHFGVTSPDARMQRSEYLGGNRLPLNVRQITQTSATESNSPMGDVAGMSVTTDNHYDFEKSFTEHGYLIGVCVARYNHTYQQGVEPDLQRSGIFSMYWPSFAHLGEQAVTNMTLYAQGYDPEDPEDYDYDSEVFGYQEAWADYRYKPNTVTGMMRSVSNSGLDTWHLADYYTELPHLSSEWLQEDKTNLDRVLTVSSAVSDQIFADIKITAKATRPMPLYSIPGLIDHF